MSNSIDLTRAALVQRFVDQWDAAPTLPPEDLPARRIQLPNKKMERGTSKPYGRLSVAFSGRQNAAVGGARVRIRGILYLQVFVPEGSGTRVLTCAGDTFASIFDNRALLHLSGSGTVDCAAMDIFATGLRDGYEQMTFGIPFYSDENR
jgi:hypothetical protein